MMSGKANKVQRLPEGWQEVRLGEACRIIISPVDKKTIEGETPVKLCNYMDVYYNNFIDSRINFMIATANPKEIEKFSIIEGDVIITKDSETPDDIGVPAYVKETIKHLLCGYHLAILRPKKQTTGKYILYALGSPRIKHYFYKFANGITRFGLTIESYQKIKILLPPLPEQKAIASLLETWDTAIEKTEALIAAKEKRFKWLLKTLISDQQDNPKWRKVKLGDIGTTYGGLQGKVKKDFGYGKPYIPYLNIFQNKHIDPAKLDYVSIEKNETQNRVKIGDVFFTTSSETPQDVATSSTLLDDLGECYLNSFCFGYRFEHNILLPEFSQYLFRSVFFRKVASVLAQGATRFNISKNQLMKTAVLLPPLPEQKTIASLLETWDTDIEKTRALAKAYHTQKRGLMQKLLIGKWRVML